jgi:hypothetical protein
MPPAIEHMLNLEVIFSITASFLPMRDYLEAWPLKNLSTTDMPLVLGLYTLRDCLGWLSKIDEWFPLFYLLLSCL